MVSILTNPPQPENFDGFAPVDFPVLTESDLQGFDTYSRGMEAFCTEMENLVRLDSYLEDVRPDPTMLKIAVEHFGLGEHVSKEDINDSSREVWDRTKMNMRRFYSDAYGYAKVIQSGSDRLVERLTMLGDMADNIKTRPYKPEVTIQNNKKYRINGRFEPHELRPVMEQTQNVLDFYDKVLINLITQVDKALGSVDMQHEWTNRAIVKLDDFAAQRWMTNARPQEDQDERFHVNAQVFASQAAQGDRTLYYVGPNETKTEEIKDWNFIVSAVKNIKLKFYTAKDSIPINEEENKVAVANSTMGVRQRVTYLLGLAKRIQSREGYDQKIASALRRLEGTAGNIRREAGQMRSQVNLNQAQEDKVEGKPVVSQIVKDTTTLLNALTRLVTDYNNAVAGQIRLIAALALAADIELKAYTPPVRKPTGQEVDQLNQA